MLTLRLIGLDDYKVREDGHPIGRIRFDDHFWSWTVTVTLPGPPSGSAASLEDAKAGFKAAWQDFKSKQAPEELAKAFEQTANANRPGRFGR